MNTEVTSEQLNAVIDWMMRHMWQSKIAFNKDGTVRRIQLDMRDTTVSDGAFAEKHALNALIQASKEITK